MFETRKAWMHHTCWTHLSQGNMLLLRQYGLPYQLQSLTVEFVVKNPSLPPHPSRKTPRGKTQSFILDAVQNCPGKCLFLG